MDKLKMHSINKVDENIEKIGKLFPNCITERKNEKGEVEYAVDFDMLKQELSSVVVEGNEERYQFTWPDKKKAILLANAPIAKTLRPCREESVDFDNTENLYIEGDNLDVLKLLQETYLGKIKMIYIDPPYNTGNDFVYNDDFAESAEEYLANSGQFDEDGNRLVANTESNGRYHTDWLNMIYPRLKTAKNLLADDGVIFISIDDNELENLKKVCDEVFGEQNFSTQFIWTKTSTPPSLSHKCRKTVEYVLCYEKNLDNTRYFGSLLSGGDVPLLNSGNPIKELLFPVGSVRFNFVKNGKVDCGAYEKVELLDDIIVADGVNQNKFRMKAEFKWGQPMLNEEVANGTYFVIKTEKLSIRFQRPYDENNFKTPNNFLNIELNKEIGIGTNESAVKELENLSLSKFFDFPKPVSLIKYLINMICKFDKEAIILDFFSGSATTAHSIMQLNAEDGGNRKFIMVQLPEETDEKSEAYKAGYKNICEIGKERIRRAGDKIKEESQDKTQIKEAINALCKEKQQILSQQDEHWIEMYCAGELTLDALKIQLQGTNNIISEIEEFIDELTLQLKIDVKKLDTGFRVLKLDSTNMKDVYYNPADYELSLFDNLADNIKEDRTPEDLLFQVMLDLGVLLSSKIEESTIGGKKVFNVADGFLYACFDENVTEDIITEIAKKNPYYFVMRDSSMANDSVATNFEQIFATYSPNTERKVL